MPIQLDDDEEPMESESNRVDKKAPATITEDLNQTTDQVVEKKKKRCAQCNKKLTISAQYTCRCGLTFCPEHR